MIRTEEFQLEVDVFYHDDSLTRLKKLPGESVQCVVTSVPYWGIRDYGVAGQLGLEETPELYIRKMVRLFREVRRVLKRSGTLWLNVGDTWWGGKGTSGSENFESRNERFENGTAITRPSYAVAGHRGGIRPQDRNHKLIKPKDMVGIPWMLAIALRNDGWFLRQDIIWHKPNPMPESAKDRCTKAHEYIFLLSKSPDPVYWNHDDLPYDQGVWIKPEPDWRWVNKKTRAIVKEEPTNWQAEKTWRRYNAWNGNDYYFNYQAIQEPASWNTHPKVSKKKLPFGWDAGEGNHRSMKGRYNNKVTPKAELNVDLFGVKNNPSFTSSVLEDPAMRMKRDVWSIADGLDVWRWIFKNLPEASHEQMTELFYKYVEAAGEKRSVWSMIPDSSAGDHTATFPMELPKICILASTRPGDVVMDCFMGTGRTAEAAKKLERHYIGIEINQRDILTSKRMMNHHFGFFDPEYLKVQNLYSIPKKRGRKKKSETASDLRTVENNNDGIA